MTKKSVLDKAKFHLFLKTNNFEKEIGFKDKRFYVLYQKLEDAFTPQYQKNLKDRVQKLHKISDKKFNAALVELKRFFIMTALFEKVPMYSYDVDLLWHEMLMFTWEYDKFCMDFIGEKIHHKPEIKQIGNNTNKDPHENYNRRVLFEVVYGNIFEINEASHYFHGYIYEDIPENFGEILDKYFVPKKNIYGENLMQVL